MTRPTIQTYQQADAFLGRARSLSTGQRGTRVERVSDTVITVWYHDTPVVTYYRPGTRNRVATIDTAGWKTPTTISRIQEYAPEGIEVWTAGIEGEVEMVFLDDETNGVERWPLSSEAYHMLTTMPARQS